MDSRPSPQRIGNAHVADKLADLQPYGWSATSAAPRLPPPYDLNPARCHFMTVSGFTIARARRTVGAKRYNPTKISRSAVLKVCLFGEFRRSRLI
jgi:hypothetical protein